MPKSSILLTFETFAQMFLDFEKEFNATLEGNTAFSIEIQMDEFRSFWTKVKGVYEAFATSDEVDVEGDRDATRELFGHCRLGYFTVAALMFELYQICVNRSEISSTKYQSGRGNENGFRNHIQLPPCISKVFHGDYESWPTFRDMFTAVYVKSVNISPVEELFYLRQFTQVEALEMSKNHL